MARTALRGRAWRVRSASSRDARAIAEIYNEAVLHTAATFDTAPRSVAEQRRWLAHHAPRYPVVVAEANGAVVGWASLSAWSDRCAYEDTAEVSFYVREDWRGRGVGRGLLTKLVVEAERSGLHTLLARIAIPNPVSAHLHRTLGFRSIGVMHEVGLKFGRRIDVELFERLPDPRPAPKLRGRLEKDAPARSGANTGRSSPPRRRASTAG